MLITEERLLDAAGHPALTGDAAGLSLRPTPSSSSGGPVFGSATQQGTPL
jgi:hypothetical protein